mmetsp:Transcript_6228/g.10151  ORF Transcript_6228/g.10151 Transcript_6228/m.10151 type:complete len:183 (-) Transcript_6228:594-1142(-)
MYAARLRDNYSNNLSYNQTIELKFFLNSINVKNKAQSSGKGNNYFISKDLGYELCIFQLTPEHQIIGGKPTDEICLHFGELQFCSEHSKYWLKFTGELAKDLQLNSQKRQELTFMQKMKLKMQGSRSQIIKFKHLDRIDYGSTKPEGRGVFSMLKNTLLKAASHLKFDEWRYLTFISKNLKK